MDEKTKGEKPQAATTSVSAKYQKLRLERKAKKMMTPAKADHLRRIGLIK